MKRMAAALFILMSLSASAANGLRVVSAGPVGEVATLAEANEIRVVFSEPMVVLGKIPNPVTAPFFKLEPAVAGAFRWSGTTTLIFTPQKPLPYATEYKVTIDQSAKAVSGKTLDQPYQWSFTTPTIRLVTADWYRKKNGAIAIALIFNQDVEPSSVVPYLQLRPKAHQIDPVAPPEGDTAGFEAKWAKALAAAESDGQQVLSFLAADWDKERWPADKKRIVLETKPGIPPDTWIELVLDEKLGSAPGRANTGRVQNYTFQLEPTLFVADIGCVEECDPESYNGINFKTGPGIRFEEARKAVSVTDITDPKKPVALKPKAVNREYDYPQWSFGLDELGFSIQPARTYRVTVAPTLTAEDGQKLGYTWTKTVEFWHKSAFVSFGAGHGVWESGGGPVLPFHSRNFKSVKQWLAPLKIEDLMPTMRRLRDANFTVAPDTKPTTRKLTTALDKIGAIGFDLKPAIGDDNLGLAWVAVEPGEPQPKTKIYDPAVRSTLVQATNLGLSVKDSPQNTLIMVTRLDTAQPVEGAKVTIRDRDNKVFWTGTTDAKGLAVASRTDLRRDRDASEEQAYDNNWTALSELHFIVIAEKDGDVAYVGSDWTEGITPWDFGTPWNLVEADAQLRGTVFADRGVYKLGEEVHLKAVVRSDTPDGMKLMPGSQLVVVIRDSHGTDLETQVVDLNQWSSADFTFTVPDGAPLGDYTVEATSEKYRGAISGTFLVAAYRRPDFRVDATLDAPSTLAGTKLNGVISGRYLYGGAMGGKDVNWTYAKIELDDVPRAVADRFPTDRFAYLDEDDVWDDQEGTVTISSNEAKLDAKGELRLSLETDLAAGKPYAYTLEGVVIDVTRQQIAGRATFRVDPAPWYIGVKRPPYFADTKNGIDTEIVAVAIDGLATPGVDVKVSLKRIQWASVRQSEGDGFYAWQSERKELEAGEWTVKTQATPVPLHIPITEGGEFLIVARAEDGKGRVSETRVSFYAVGDGYTAWERHDHNRIELVPEKTTYKPGDTARIMVKSPWEKATALLTTEREGVRTYTPFELTSTQQTITVPIKETDIPNVFVSVLLVKGRTSQDPGKDGSDPGKPAFRLGYVELKVEDETKRLAVDVKANKAEYRPGNKATIEVNVKDAKGKPAQAEVTLWAVDYGVLSLTGYTTPDVLDSIYLDKSLQVATTESRQRIVSRRVLSPKGAGEGGGGGRDAGVGTLRKDFRVLAFWVGSLVTDAKGRAKTDVTLPDSLSTYRIMAVAGDKQSRFGGADSEIRINKPLMLTPAWPRFLHVGDTAHFGGVVHNQLTRGGKATVSIESLDPHILSFANGQSNVTVQPKTPLEVRFDATAKAVGVARVRMRVAMGRETDAFEQTIPVQVMISPETVAAYGEANPRAEEKLDVPADAVPGFGGLRVDLSSTMLVGLSEGARYLIEYPYGCAEQKSSRALALMLLTDLGTEFNVPGIEPDKQKTAVQEALTDLAEYQCGDGGFAFWPGQCNYPSSPFLTSYVVHVMQRGKALKYATDDALLERAYTYLDQKLNEPKPENEGWMPAYTSWQAFATKVLAEGGRNVDSHVNRLYEYRDRMPVFGISFLLDALTAKGEKTGARATDLERRIMNSIKPEGGTAFVNELADPYLLWFWNSNVRSTAIAMDTLIRRGTQEEMVKRMVRWLMRVREDGRWGNTQENAWAMESLVDYYRKYEAAVPDFTGTVTWGEQKIATETFKGRTTDVRAKQFSMNELLKRPGVSPLVMQKDGAGTLFYMLRLRYARDVLGLKPLDAGFQVERSYAIEGTDAEKTTFKAGDLIKVTLRIRNTKERRYVAMTDPIPAGTEPVEAWFATTAMRLSETQTSYESTGGWEFWTRGGWDYIERHDNRVNVFATRLGEGNHTFTYLVRATTAGSFVTAPTYIEEMYEPEVFGRTGTTKVDIAR